MNTSRLCAGSLLFATIFCGSAAIGFAQAPDLAPILIQRCKAATALVDLGENGTGTAFYVNRCGLFATARHVVDEVAPGEKVKLILKPGEAGQKILSARVAMMSEEDDLALLKTEDVVDAEPLALGGDNGLVELTKTIVFGYPFGKMVAGGGGYPAVSVNVGRVSSLRREGGQLERIQLDAATNPGNSGGPVVNDQGRVMGIIVSGFRGANVNFAIPATKLWYMIGQPVLALKTPVIGYAKRAEPQDFEVEVLPTVGMPADAEVTLRLGDGATARAIPMLKKDGKLHATAVPSDGRAAPASTRLRVEAIFGSVAVQLNMDDCQISVGKRSLRLSDIREIGRAGKALKTTLVHQVPGKDEYEVLDGPVTGWPQIKSALNDVALPWENVSRVKVNAYDPGTTYVPYELTMTSRGKLYARAKGTIYFNDPPPTLEAPGQLATMTKRRGNVVMHTQEGPGFKIEPLFDKAKDVKQGTWEQKNGLLETKPEPGAWCELPVIPTGNYILKLRLIPKQDAKGELLLQLPMGKGRAILHLDGSTKSGARLDLLPGKDVDGLATAAFAAFSKDKPCDLHVAVAARGEYGHIAFASGDQKPLVWTGKLKDLAPAAALPIGADRIALGHHGLEMTVEQMEINTNSGGLRVLRELPQTIDLIGEDIAGQWSFDGGVAKGKLSSDGKGLVGTLAGTAELVPSGGISGGGALKLSGTEAGLQVEEQPASNKAQHPERTISLWINADDPAAKGQRQYLYEEGGSDKGYAIYLQNGTLVAGGWDSTAAWPGTWLHAPGFPAHSWQHVALTVNGRPKQKSMVLYLNGKEAEKGAGNAIGPHDPISIGNASGTFGFNSAEPGNAGITNHQFSGMIDQVHVFNWSLYPEGVSLLSGGRFSVAK